MGQAQKIKISALQMSSVTGDKKANFKLVENIVARELEKNTDFLVLPEVWTVGWSCEDFLSSAETLDNSDTIKLLSSIAKDYNVNILGGSFILKSDDGKYYNTCPAINRKGELIAMYSKMHLYSYCGCNEGSYITPGKSPVMVAIDGVKIGLTICYDIRFPEIFRAYRKAGVELLINMAAWGLHKPIPWETLTRCRAIENQAYMIALTQSGKITDEEWNIGHSRIFNYTGETPAEIKEQNEGAMSAVLNFAPLRKYRSECRIMDDIAESYEVKYYEKVH